ncbi:type VII secretion integral membrane protein EccD [Kineosporia babensis]|uniref:Type VII secretion integral membrane protein EccD n=1 Tax=Kineosporia babensis TaxID=499548 RepID=A0A9X1ST65_9ACTN|nr:type VII secretion integral membrane protein EccD [Kineosporia babensis]MCD5310300.1 type VII secretion integral membrane protein EccD [Kineosporia babensis]
MPDLSTGELCRLVITGPTSQVDLSVPVHVPLSDLMPALLQALGPDLADRGLEHSGWVLQRLGETPLDEDRTVEELRLADGQHLHLRPRSEQIPPLDFDDLIDGIATGLSGRSGLWRAAWTRTAALSVAVAALAAAILVLRAEPGYAHPIFGLVVTIAFLSAAWTAEHRVKDRAFAVTLAVCGVTFAVDGSLGLIDAIALDPELYVMTSLFAATAGLVVAGTAAVLIVGPHRPGPWFVAMLLVAGLTLATGLLMLATEFSNAQIATVGLVAAAAVRPYVPTLGFRLSRLRLPELPVDTADLQKDIDPEPGGEVVDGAAEADQMMTALYVAIGLATTAALVVLALEPGWIAPTTAAVATIAPFLALRAMTSAWHRLALALPSLIGLAVLAVDTAGDVNTLWRMVLAGVLAGTAAVLAVLAHTLPLRRLTPIWGRIGDFLHVISLTALLPLAFGVLGYYAVIRAMVG